MSLYAATSCLLVALATEAFAEGLYFVDVTMESGIQLKNTSGNIFGFHDSEGASKPAFKEIGVCPFQIGYHFSDLGSILYAYNSLTCIVSYVLIEGSRAVPNGTFSRGFDPQHSVKYV